MSSIVKVLAEEQGDSRPAAADAPAGAAQVAAAGGAVDQPKPAAEAAAAPNSAAGADEGDLEQQQPAADVEKQAAEGGEEAEGADPDFSRLHPLEDSWTLWFDHPGAKQSADTYGASLR